MATTKNGSAVGLSSILNDNKFKEELDLMVDSYYNYLSPTTKFFTNYKSTTDAIEVFTGELAKVEMLLKGKGIGEDSFIIEKFGSSFVKKPQIGQRQLPDFFRGNQISRANELVGLNAEFGIWKESGFNLLFQIEIAQCKAIKKYKIGLEEKLQQLQLGTSRNAAIKSFNWLNDEKKLNDLFGLLKERGVIDCKKETFLNAFSKEAKTISTPLNICWHLVSKNGQTSKASLFYFIQGLRDKGFVTSPQPSFQLKTIQAIFNDTNGNPLRNLKQSKENSPKREDRRVIDDILKKL